MLFESFMLYGKVLQFMVRPSMVLHFMVKFYSLW